MLDNSRIERVAKGGRVTLDIKSKLSSFEGEIEAFEDDFILFVRGVIFLNVFPVLVP